MPDGWDKSLVARYADRLVLTKPKAYPQFEAPSQRNPSFDKRIHREVNMKVCAGTLEAEMTPEEHSFLLHLLQQPHGHGSHLEIGTAAGGTLCAMLRAFSPSHRPRFSVIDTMQYFPEQLECVHQNLRANGLDPHQVDFRISRSDCAFQQAADSGDSFDFILIDACHKIRSVMSDLRWTRLLSVGGIVCLHDYAPKFRGVMLAVDRFLHRHPNYERIDCRGSLIAFRKTAVSSAAPEVTAADQLYALAWYFPLQFQSKWARMRRAA